MKPGRLFWKFFFCFWLAQLVTAMGVGAAIWAFHLRPAPNQAMPPPFRDSPPGQAREFGPPPPQPHHAPWFPPAPPLIAGSIVSLVFAGLLAWYFARPLAVLRQAFQSTARGELDTRIAGAMGHRRDELADLGHDFDAMTSRLQALVADKQRLLHDVSHEIRSPLNRLHAAADLMQQQPARSAELIERIRREAERIDHLVSELLTLSRLGSSFESQPMERIDVHELIAELADDIRFEAGGHCWVNYRIHGKPAITGVFSQIRRAIENVMRNAVRHTLPGSIVCLLATQHEHDVSIEVTDAGSGMPADELEHIFKPFFRGSNSTPYEGYGLGLAIAHEIVKLHGGSIEARNLANGGFSLLIRLPSSIHRQRQADSAITH